MNAHAGRVCWGVKFPRSIREKFHKGGEYSRAHRPSTESDKVKKDLAIALVAIVLVSAICYGLAISRPPFKPTPSEPFSTASVGLAVNEKIVMRINGEPVTEREFEAAYRELPEETQRQYASEPGKMAFAEQLVRLKLLEQEARRRGIDRDPKIAAQLSADRLNILASAAAERLVAPPTEEAIKNFYAENKNRFATVDVSHILIAYAGGAVPPRGGGAAPSEVEATNKALAIYAQLRAGADFATVARKVSDDTATADRGGAFGGLSPGMLPQELEARVFNIPTGQFSGPIPSRFGVHIFKVNSRGTRSLAQLHAGIAQRVRQQNMYDRVELLRRNANVQFDDKFFPEAKKWPSGRKPS